MSSLGKAVALACLALGLGNLSLPLVALALAEAPAARCCAAGRCCCSGTPARTPDDGGTCLRRGCGCGGAEDTTLPPLLRVEAVLPRVGAPTAPAPARAFRIGSRPRPLARPHEPPVPPPKAALAA